MQLMQCPNLMSILRVKMKAIERSELDNAANDKPQYMVSAHFFLRGKGVNPDEITTLLGRVPEMGHKTGDQHGEHGEMIWKSGFWLIDTQPFVISQDMDQHVVWILDLLEEAKDELKAIQLREDVYMELKIVISLFRRNWDAILSPKTIERLSDLNIPFSLSVSYLAYPHEEE